MGFSESARCCHTPSGSNVQGHSRNNPYPTEHHQFQTAMRKSTDAKYGRLKFISASAPWVSRDLQLLRKRGSSGTAGLCFGFLLGFGFFLLASFLLFEFLLVLPLEGGFLFIRPSDWFEETL